jgi:hypothetical protein
LRDACATHRHGGLNGIAVQAANGATEKELRLVSAVAMLAWPARAIAAFAINGLR